MATKKKESAKPKEVVKTASGPTVGGLAEDFERLGVFYLGRPYDLATKQSKPGWLLYDSKDLVTHAVCVGMTGSGKTGLCIGLLEEAAIDGIPALIIDPKGDLANLMLNFPQLRGEDFAPWINEDDARKKGLSPADYATQQAEMWRKAWGIGASAANKAKSYEAWNKDFAGWLFRTQKVDLFKSPSTKDVSKPGESERDFRVRLQQSGREARDKQSASLRQKYAPMIAALQDRIRRAGQMVERRQAESRSSQMQAAISVGATILGAFLGRKTISATNIGRTTRAIRGAGRAIKESKDVGQAEDNVSALQQQLADLESQFKTETDAFAATTDPLNEKAKPSLSNPPKLTSP